jgi:Insect cuticle protein
MAFKLVIFFAAASMASAGIIADYAQPAYYQPQAAVYKQAAIVKQVVHEEPANYEFNYDVHDHQTGDIKQQHESAKDGVISGQYSLIDADGHRRIVDYTADDHHGFNANVRREPLEGHKVIKTVQPVLAVQKIIAQPAIAVQKYIQSAPQYYSEPSHYHH